MAIPKTDIIQQLRREIIALDGLRHVPMDDAPQEGMGLFADHFPQGRFPLGAVHELKPFAEADQPATLGFSLALMQTVLPAEGIIAWVSAQPMPLYAPGLRQIGLDPARVIFVRARKPSDRQWAMEEALQCTSLTAVVGELEKLDFKQSRRLQLAAEKSGVTAWVLPSPRAAKTNASTSRWSIRSLPSEAEGDLPGIGDPQWQIDLLHMRHGKPGSWTIRWSEGRFQLVGPRPGAIDIPKKGGLLQPFPAEHLLEGYYLSEKSVYA